MSAGNVPIMIQPLYTSFLRRESGGFNRSYRNAVTNLLAFYP